MDLKKKRICKQKEEEQDQSDNGIHNLPHEIAIDILSRLPITCLLQSRFVSRAWHSLSLDQNLVNLHLSQAENLDPLLIFHSDFPIRNQLCFAEFSENDDDQGSILKNISTPCSASMLEYSTTITNQLCFAEFCDTGDGKGLILKKFSTPFSASMPEYIVVGSCNGLLCLSDSLYNDAIYLYNPFTRHYRELPKSRQYDDQEVMCGFGFHPGTKEYKVIKIIYYWNFVNTAHPPFVRFHRFRNPRNIKSEVQIFSLGSNTWRSLGDASFNFQRRSSEALLTNGRLHWLTRGMYNNVRGLIIVSFDLADEKFHEVPRPDFSSRRSRSYHLAILRGCLSAVVNIAGDLEIWTMKEYNVKESWIKEFRIEPHLQELQHNKIPQPFRIWRNSSNRIPIRVLCIRKNGEILVEYKVGRLALYDPKSEQYRGVTIQGMPKLFKTVVHVGSLNWIDFPN